jgi:tRNA/rRNA methyltransferase
MTTRGLAGLSRDAPRRFPDRDAWWRRSRATDVLAHATVCSSLDEALRGVGLAVACTARSRELAVPQVNAREAAAEAIALARTQTVAFVFGNETSGLNSAEVSRCQLLATIPANARYSSLNLAAAVQVFAYELRLAAAANVVTPARPPRLASVDQLEGFYAQLERAMVETGFFDPRHPKKLMPRLRRLFGRARLEREEINILRGIVTSFQSHKARR